MTNVTRRWKLNSADANTHHDGFLPSVNVPAQTNGMRPTRNEKQMHEYRPSDLNAKLSTFPWGPPLKHHIRSEVTNETTDEDEEIPYISSAQPQTTATTSLFEETLQSPTALTLHPTSAPFLNKVAATQSNACSPSMSSSTMPLTHKVDWRRGQLSRQRERQQQLETVAQKPDLSDPQAPDSSAKVSGYFRSVGFAEHTMPLPDPRLPSSVPSSTTVSCNDSTRASKNIGITSVHPFTPRFKSGSPVSQGGLTIRDLVEQEKHVSLYKDSILGTAVATGESEGVKCSVDFVESRDNRYKKAATGGTARHTPHAKYNYSLYHLMPQDEGSVKQDSHLSMRMGAPTKPIYGDHEDTLSKPGSMNKGLLRHIPSMSILESDAQQWDALCYRRSGALYSENVSKTTAPTLGMEPVQRGLLKSEQSAAAIVADEAFRFTSESVTQRSEVLSKTNMVDSEPPQEPKGKWTFTTHQHHHETLPMESHEHTNVLGLTPKEALSYRSGFLSASSPRCARTLPPKKNSISESRYGLNSHCENAVSISENEDEMLVEAKRLSQLNGTKQEIATGPPDSGVMISPYQRSKNVNVRKRPDKKLPEHANLAMRSCGRTAWYPWPKEDGNEASTEKIQSENNNQTEQCIDPAFMHLSQSAQTPLRNLEPQPPKKSSDEPKSMGASSNGNASRSAKVTEAKKSFHSSSSRAKPYHATKVEGHFDSLALALVERDTRALGLYPVQKYHSPPMERLCSHSNVSSTLVSVSLPDSTREVSRALLQDENLSGEGESGPALRLTESRVHDCARKVTEEKNDSTKFEEVDIDGISDAEMDGWTDVQREEVDPWKVLKRQDWEGPLQLYP